MLCYIYTACLIQCILVQPDIKLTNFTWCKLIVCTLNWNINVSSHKFRWWKGSYLLSEASPLFLIFCIIKLGVHPNHSLASITRSKVCKLQRVHYLYKLYVHCMLVLALSLPYKTLFGFFPILLFFLTWHRVSVS